MPKNKVELRPAYEWTCDECGRDNFVGGVIVEIDEDTQTELLAMGLEEPMCQTGQWQTQPEEVKCDHCGEEFEVEDIGPRRDDFGESEARDE